MESHLSEDALWAGALAARLKVLQANFAHDHPATRQEFITQEIMRAHPAENLLLGRPSS